MSNIIACLECNPVIAAIGDDKWQKALASPAQVIFYLSANLLTIGERVRQAHAAQKYILVHLDLTEGIGKDRTGIRYLAQCGADGILSTQGQLIRLAKEQGLFTVQRFFAVDSGGTEGIGDVFRNINPHLIELMPGVVTQVIRTCADRGIPVIAGGLTRNIVQCLEDFDIPLYLNTTVVQIHGSKRVEGVTIAQVDEQRRPIPETRRYIPCDTLLLSVGLIPENELTRTAGIPMDPVTSGALVDERGQTRIPGIFACGNVLQVHDLVDYVSEEGERAGVGAAAFVREYHPQSATIRTQPGANARYVLPQMIHSAKEDVSLSFRVSRPFGKVRYTVCAGDTVLATAVRPKAAPGEMERISLKADKLPPAGETITVNLEVLE